MHSFSHKGAPCHLFAICDGHGVYGHLVSYFIKQEFPSSRRSLPLTRILRHPQGLATLRDLPREGALQLDPAARGPAREILDQPRDQRLDAGRGAADRQPPLLRERGRLPCDPGPAAALLLLEVGAPRALGRPQARAAEGDRADREGGRQGERGARLHWQAEGAQAGLETEGGCPGTGDVEIDRGHDREIRGGDLGARFMELMGREGVHCNFMAELKEFAIENRHKFIVLGSDGLWEFLGNEEVGFSLYIETPLILVREYSGTVFPEEQPGRSLRLPSA